MKRLLTVAALALLLGAMRSPVLAAEDEYDDMQAHPLVLAYYVAHPVGYALEWLVTRPIHYIVSRPSLERVFGHVPHEEIGMYHELQRPNEPRW
jgi:hypothetical protein